MIKLYKANFFRRMQSASKILLLTTVAFQLTVLAQAQISFTGTTYTQNFDALASSPATGNTFSNGTTPLPGWFLFRQPSPGTAITTYNANNGSNTAGSFYSYGTTESGERALGGLGSGGAYFGSPSSGNVAGWIAVSFTNSTGSTINSATIGFAGEQWRNGGNATAQTMVLEYGFGATFSDVTTWNVPGGNFDWTSPVATTTAGIVDGNIAGKVNNRGGTLSSLGWANNSTLWIRWIERNDAGNDHGLAIDDFSFSTSVSSVPVITIVVQDALASEQGSNPGIFRIARTGVTTDALTVNYTIGGTATNGVDYTPTLSGSVIIPVSSSFVDITITPVDDSEEEGAETVILTLSDAAAYDLGTTNTNASITIVDNDAPIVITKIHTIQGSGASSPLDGQTVTISGIVTAAYPGLDAIFVQEEDADADADPSTSEGIFVFLGTDPTVSVGDLVQVTGAVDEFFGMTQIDNDNSNLSVSFISGSNPLPTPVSISLPISSALDVDAFYEKYEGMLVTFTNKLVVSEYFQLGRFGEAVLTANNRPFTYTHVDNTPTVAENNAYMMDLSRRQITLDDETNMQYFSTPTSGAFYPQPGGFSTGTQGTNFFRGGDAINDLTGVLHWSFGGNTSLSPNAWRIRPVPAYPVQFTVENPRPAAPASVGGNIKVASFNVLNYFTTLNSRGADNAAELVRQTDKLVQAVIGTNADVLGLMEVENNGGTTLTALVNALNNVAGPGTYGFINTGVVGTDQITCAIIYKPAVVTPQGAAAILNDPSFTNPNNLGGQQNRPAIASTFQVTGAGNPDLGSRFTVVVNHLKAKGSSGPGLDNDQMDGQSAYNSTRTKGAQALAQWLTTDPTGSGDPDFLIIGDLNSYKGEDPITALKNLGYTELIEQFSGNNAYGYVFDGQTGYLDYALSNSTLTAQVTGVTEWHINADEVNLFDYNTENKPAGASLYEVNAFRTSDHDPVIIGLDLTPVHTWYRDKDGDGYGSGSRTIIAVTQPNGYVSNPYDCNDSNADVHSGAPELEDGIDNDCDGEVDEDLPCRKLWYKDADGDGYGRNTVTRYSCVPLGINWVLIGGDCKDNDPDVYPGAPEICDGKNNDCNSDTREDCSLITSAESAKPATTAKQATKVEVEGKTLEATIWPNPARTELMVTLDAFVPNQKLSITMMQVDGKVQQSQSLIPAVKGQQVRLDVSRSVGGFYLLQIKQNGLSVTKRFIIIK